MDKEASLNEIIIKEIKKDRERLLKAIEESHMYVFDDVAEEVEIKLSDNWDAYYIRA